MAVNTESDTSADASENAAAESSVLLTGVSGNLGLRLLEFLPNFKIIGVDVNPLQDSSRLAHFEKIDLGVERSCDQLLQLMRAYRPDAVVHLAFILDPLRTGVLDRMQMWNVNVAGSGRVIEAIAEYNRMFGGLQKFVYPSSISVYGADLTKAVREDAPLRAQSLTYALHKQETDLTIQARSRGMRCTTYILRPAIFVGPRVQNYMLGVLRGVPGGQGVWARRMRARNTRLPLVVPSGGNYLAHPFQFVHVDDVARLIAHILNRSQTDPQISILNVAGRGDPLPLQSCARIAGIEIKRLPTRMLCRTVLRLLWSLGISDIPPEAFLYLLGSYTMDTARLRVFLGDAYHEVIHYTCEEAITDAFATPDRNQQAALAR